MAFPIEEYIQARRFQAEQERPVGWQRFSEALSTGLGAYLQQKQKQWDWEKLVQEETMKMQAEGEKEKRKSIRDVILQGYELKKGGERVYPTTGQLETGKLPSEYIIGEKALTPAQKSLQDYRNAMLKLRKQAQGGELKDTDIVKIYHNLQQDAIDPYLTFDPERKTQIEQDMITWRPLYEKALENMKKQKAVPLQPQKQEKQMKISLEDIFK